MVVWKCIICGAEFKGTPPRRCTSCDTPAGRFRLMCDRPPSPPPEKPVEEEAVEEEASATPDSPASPAVAEAVEAEKTPVTDASASEASE